MHNKHSQCDIYSGARFVPEKAWHKTITYINAPAVGVKSTHMSKKGIVWGVIAYLIVWLAFIVSLNVFGFSEHYVGVSLILAQVLSGVVAAKNSTRLPPVNSVIAGTIVGTLIALWVAFASDAPVFDILYIVAQVALYFGLGGVLWLAVSLLTRQARRTR